MSYFVVVCNSADNSFGLYDLNDNGKLAHIRDVPFPDVGAPSGAYPLALSPDRGKLYLAFRGTPYEVLTFAIDKAGRDLKLLGRAPLADSMAHIAVDSTGHFLYSASYGGGKVSVNPISADGVAQAPSDTLEVAGKMHCCIPVPDSNAFFATSLAADTIFKFTVSDDGKLTQAPEQAKVDAGNGPRHFVLHPNMRWGYLVTEQTSTVDVFALAGGKLSEKPVQTISNLPPHWQGETWAADIRISPDGKFVYASDRKAYSIGCYAVDAESGKLTATGFTYGPAWPRAFNISTDGRFLLALGENTNVVEVFGRDATTGVLDKRHALATGGAPAWVEIIS